MRKRILITGATGMIGKPLTRKLCNEGAYVKILTGNAKAARSMFEKHFSLEAFNYDNYESPDLLSKLLSDVDVVINLAGANVGAKRWSTEYKDEIYNSRINLTRRLVHAIKHSDSPPSCLISASGVGYYGDKGDEILTEDSSTGNDFLAHVCRDWEREAMYAKDSGARVVIVRTGIVLDKSEGALPKLLIPFRFLFGSYQGSGNQWLSWIHLHDLVNLYVYAIDNEALKGPVNATAPDPVRNKDLIKEAAKILHRKLIIPAPAFALRIALGEFADSLLTGQRAIPEKAMDEGFEFIYPDIRKALADLLPK